MANELKITDVVDKSVFDQLDRLKTEFNEMTIKSKHNKKNLKVIINYTIRY